MVVSLPIMRTFIVCIVLSMLSAFGFAQNLSYNTRQVQAYQREAAYYLRQAESYQREADYYNRQTQNNLREAEFYVRQKKYDRAKIYQDRARNMADKTMVYSHKADKARDRAADYTQKANAMLNKNKKFYDEKLVRIYDNDVVLCKLFRTTDNGRNGIFNKVDRTEKHDFQSARLNHVIALSSSLGRWFGISETGRLLSRWYWCEEGFLWYDYYGSHGRGAWSNQSHR